MQAFGEDVTEELEYIPAQAFVREHVRPKYACKCCQQGVVQAGLPPRPIEKGIPGPGLLAQVLTAKYVDHLPLYRQSRIFKRFGLDLARSTLCETYARPTNVLTSGLPSRLRRCRCTPRWRVSSTTLGAIRSTSRCWR